MRDISTANLAADCPDAETLAAYVDGLLTPEARAQVEAHAADCRDCREILADTAAFLLDVQGQRVPAPEGDRVSSPAPKVLVFKPRWRGGLIAMLAVAAAALIVVRLDPAWLPWSDRAPDISGLVAALDSQGTRPIEGRLSAGLAYRPPPVVTRGTAGREVPPDVQIAASRLELAASGQSPAQLTARGIAALATGEVDQAMVELDRAMRQIPADAPLLNDLAVVHLARASASGRTEDWRLALDYAERALALSPAMREALFNRAVALAGLNRPDDERSAWRAYLKVDPASEWAEEARSRCRCSS